MSCLFNSLNHFIGEGSYEIRQKICNYLQENNPIIDGLKTNSILETENLSAEQYISNMRLTSTMGGAIEIQCACNIWGMQINVNNCRDGNNQIIEFIPLNNSHNKIVYIYWNGGHYEPIKQKINV